ncbi:MAG: DUF6544 family protein [Myxococcales bacterium]
MWTTLWKEVDSRNLAATPPPPEQVTEGELARLPTAARALMRFFGVKAGQAKPWSLALAWTGRFRRTPDEPWMPIEAVQYDTRVPVARIFHMKARMKGVPVLARDTYALGRGRMVAKLAGIVTVADGTGPEFDIGECVTWLNDMILFAPSMLLGPATRWSHVDDRSFDITFVDAGTTVTARVFVDERGAPIDFETTDRYLNDPNDPRHALIRGHWSTPVESWHVIRGRPFPGGGKAIWHLAAGDFVYAEFKPLPGSLQLDEAPRGQPS